MLKFNSNNIVVGEIKEILKSFNLPSYKVLVRNKPVSIFKGFNYIFNDMILVSLVNKDFESFEFNESDFSFRSTYYYNQEILNITHNLAIKNINYDYITHNRLGNYLRFIRDYRGLNLMSMYNCFNGQSANNVDIKFETSYVDEEGKKTITHIFNTSDNSYKLLTIPVKYNCDYTFFIDCPTELEITACFYLNNNQLNDLVVGSSSKVLENSLYANTYMKVRGSRFNTPFVYSKLKNLLTKIDSVNDETKDPFKIKKSFAQKELELTLLLKLPKDNNSSIVVLESDYSDDNEQRYYPNGLVFSSHTQYITNYEQSSLSFKKYNSYKQLTYLNDNNSYPFANRLLEYLADNVITSIDDIELNTKRVESNLIKKGVISTYTSSYSWNNNLRAKIFLNAQEKGVLNTKFDVLGYVDKDVEEKVVGFEDTTNEWEV